MRNNKISSDFNTYLANSRVFIPKIIAGLDKSKGDVKKTRMLVLLGFTEHLNLIQAMYSSNSNKVDLQKEFIKLSSFYASYIDILSTSGYSSLLNFWSIAILLEIEYDDMSAWISAFSSLSELDKLIGFLLNHYLDNFEFENLSLKFPDYAEEILSLDEPESVSNYLTNKWYKNQVDESWYDAHLNERNDLYFGYWAWDVAVIVKIKGINVETLETVDYFPYDALVW